VTITLVYDDTVVVPPDIVSLTGLSRFGRIWYRKKALATHVFAAAEGAVDEVVHLRTRDDVVAFTSRLSFPLPESRYIYYPANIAPRQDFEQARVFFHKVAYSNLEVALTVPSPDGWTGIFLVGANRMREIAKADAIGVFGIAASRCLVGVAAVENNNIFVDLARYTSFLEFITSHFQARHFNEIGYDRFTVKKSSHDKKKMRREYGYYGMIPEAMRPFFVQAFDFEEASDSASYKMERLNIPDVALQWVHDAFDQDEFQQLLDRLFHFVDSRIRRSAAGGLAEEQHRELYLTKVEERIALLKTLPIYPRLDGVLSGGTKFANVDALFKRYIKLLNKLSRGNRTQAFCVSHGDLCFSNILYDKRTQLMKLIDPRGAEVENEMFMDPYYDLAKLSHSILGNYDYINSGYFSTHIGHDLGLELKISGSAQSSKQAAFRVAVTESGFSLDAVRLYEASLFISMLPLHADEPDKLVAFALTADAILRELEQR
jgi:hypothetical protein